MFGNRKNQGDGTVTFQKFYFQVNSKPLRTGDAPYFDVFHTVYEDGKKHKVRQKTDNVGGKIRSFYVYKDEFEGNELTKFVIALDDENCPLVDKNGEMEWEANIRHTYEIQSIFSMKGQELANKLCRVLEENEDHYISIRFQKQFDKNPKTGEWDVEKLNSKGKPIYNLNIFYKEEGEEKATMVMPLFAKNAEFATHELNDEWVEAWETASKNKSNVAMAEFFENIINGTYRQTAFEMFQNRLADKGISVEMELLENGRPKYKFSKEDNPDAQQAETVMAGASNDGPPNDTDDDLPF